MHGKQRKKRGRKREEEEESESSKKEIGRETEMYEDKGRKRDKGRERERERDRESCENKQMSGGERGRGSSVYIGGRSAVISGRWMMANRRSFKKIKK